MVAVAVEDSADASVGERAAPATREERHLFAPETAFREPGEEPGSEDGGEGGGPGDAPALDGDLDLAVVHGDGRGPEGGDFGGGEARGEEGERSEEHTS